MNVYITGSGMTEEEYITFRGYRPFAQTEAVKKAVLKSIEDYGKPQLAIDYHENLDRDQFTIIPIRPIPPYYALAEVAKSYPVESQDDVDAAIRFRTEISNGGLSLMDIIANMGASGFTFEAPGERTAYTLKQRVEMNLIATDRILGRHNSGI